MSWGVYGGGISQDWLVMCVAKTYSLWSPLLVTIISHPKEGHSLPQLETFRCLNLTIELGM